MEQDQGDKDPEQVEEGAFALREQVLTPQSGYGFPHWGYRTQGYPYASGFGVGRGGSPRGGGRGRAFGGGRGRRWCW